MFLVLSTTPSFLGSYEACSLDWFRHHLHPASISCPSLCDYLRSFLTSVAPGLLTEVAFQSRTDSGSAENCVSFCSSSQFRVLSSFYEPNNSDKPHFAICITPKLVFLYLYNKCKIKIKYKNVLIIRGKAQLELYNLRRLRRLFSYNYSLWFFALSCVKLSRFSKTREHSINPVLVYLLYLKAIFFTNQSCQIGSLLLLTPFSLVRTLCFWHLP